MGWEVSKKGGWWEEDGDRWREDKEGWVAGGTKVGANGRRLRRTEERMQLDCVGYIYETFKEQINLKNSKQ